jgi:hypothetical protein
VVWIGGLALALGGIFLVQYSIEAGLIGPGVRVFLGGLLAAALIAAGEWTRRREFAIRSRTSRPRTFPSILTAAGTTVAYATIYAAYALYGFLVPGTPSCCSASWRSRRLPPRCCTGRRSPHSDRSAPSSRRCCRDATAELLGALHLSRVVTAASFALARARLWRWLAITAVVFGVLWMFPGIADTRFDRRRQRSISWSASRSPPRCSSPAALRSGRRAGPDRSGLSARSPLSVRRRRLVLARDHDGVTLIAFTLLVVATSRSRGAPKPPSRPCRRGALARS